MPPKKQAKPGAGGPGAGQAVDEDLSDVGTLPTLNEFIFMNLYAFKYKKNRLELEKTLFKQFYVNPDVAETAEQAKRNRIIQIADLINQAKAKQYLTEAEANDLKSVEEVKLRQVLARCTNEILASITVPLRREKLGDNEKFEQETIDKLESETERKEARKKRFEEQETELTVWLKDFPRNAEDFKELRRSGAQHQADIEVAIHGVFMIEEDYKIDVIDEDTTIAGLEAQDSTLDENESSKAAAKEKEEAEFTKEERIKAFQDLMYINKYARNCQENSRMRHLVAERSKCNLPDPPYEPPQEEQEEEVEEKKEKGEKKPSKGKQEEVEEVELSPEQQAVNKMFEDFGTKFQESVDKLKADFVEYKKISDPINGVQRIGLWPRKFSERELARMKAQEEEREKKEAEEEEKKAQEAEEAAASVQNKGKPKGKDAKKPDTRQGAPSRGGASSSHSVRSTSSRPKTGVEDRMRKKMMISLDDEPRNFDFQSFERVVAKMDSANTTVGGILGAMIYQIEEANKKTLDPLSNQGVNLIKKGSAMVLQKELNRHSTNAVLSVNDAGEDPRQKLMGELDDIYNKLSVEHAVVQTDYSHVFAEKKVDPEMESSPYQALFNQNDKVGIRDGSYTFMNGSTMGSYETQTLKRMDLPGINDRFKMPEKATRALAERESDTQAILKFCPLQRHLSRRLVVLKAFEQLLHDNNPEREYSFKKRNFTEEMDAKTFRQVLTQAMRLNPDVNTAYFDKEDALLMALNYKNPPGRLLRRQWSQPIKVLPDMATWRRYVKEEGMKVAPQCINIPQHRVGLIRSNQKFCFPCDNSVIRVDKNQVGARRFGASVVLKDNLVFGIKEDESKVNEKVEGDDELYNLETKKAGNLNCEFWLEFENSTRMHISMLEKVEPNKDLIPLQTMLDVRELAPKSSAGQTLEDEPTIGRESMLSRETDRKPKSSLKSPRQSYEDKPPVSKGSAEEEAKPETVAGEKEEEEEKKKQDATAQEQNLRSTTMLRMDEMYQADKGASMTFTFNEGLVVQILPNGNVQQSIIESEKIQKKASVIVSDEVQDQKEVQRVITRQGQLIRQLKDGNSIIYYPDGTITSTDHRRGIWKTTNPLGVVRERNLRQGTVRDEYTRLQISEKVDPETSAIVAVREDGLLTVTYVDRRKLLIFPDHSEILITKSGPMEEGSAVTTTLFKKEGYSPVRVTSDPVKARSGTVIGLGGTDALMGKDSIMERSYGGLISETLLPDRSTVQSYLERQELPGYNMFSTSLIHMIKRDDYSVIKVRQDGEVVVITSEERAYLNNIGKELEFGVSDYDYFFELFGVPAERRSGVYTANLDQGRLWTQDEEGNYFMIYANGDSTEKLSVSFNLDQMVQGIDNKEPCSPRFKDGEYIEDECKFLPPPKTVGEPRLFLIKNDSVVEYSSGEQLNYLFLCNRKDGEVIRSEKKIKIENEDATTHHFMKKVTEFNPTNPSHLPKDSIPKLPQVLDMVNQTVSIASEPVSERYLWRNIIEYKEPSDSDLETFESACDQKQEMRKKQSDVSQKLKLETRELSDETIKTQCKIMLRIAKTRGINVQQLLADDYKQIKIDDRNEKRNAVLETLDDYFSPHSQENSRHSHENTT